MNANKSHEPLFHITKRSPLSIQKTLLVYVCSVLIALLLSCVICSAFSGENPLIFFVSLIDGAFGTEKSIWTFIRDAMLLLGVSIAIVPAFKMKFWNLGGNGQVLIGSLATMICMYYFGKAIDNGANISNGLLICIMTVSSILAGAIWAVIPAIFKAFFDTNESLFTLMMNYIAQGLVSIFLAMWVKSGGTTLQPQKHGLLPKLFGNEYMLIIVVIAIITAFMFVYLKYSKHGYEISVVGESKSTAKYIGLGIKKVYIRTLALSGAICGLVGLLLVGAVSPTIGQDTAKNMGFTAIMTTWLGNCNPLIMIGTCFLITFFTKGMKQVQIDYSFTTSAISNVVLGIIYLFVIGGAFFTQYSIVFRKNKRSEE